MYISRFPYFPISIFPDFHIFPFPISVEISRRAKSALSQLDDCYPKKATDILRFQNFFITFARIHRQGL